jgi:hypothetical protein
VVSNLRFGQNVLTNNYDPNLLKGLACVRRTGAVNVRRAAQLLPRASVEVRIRVARSAASR